MLENNDLFSNDKIGVSIESGGNPIIRGNRINKNGIFAILVLRRGGGVIEDNDLRDNKLGGLKIVEDGSTTVRCLRNLEVDP